MKNNNNDQDVGNLTEEAYALMSLYRGFADGQTALFNGTYVDSSPSSSTSTGMLHNDIDYISSDRGVANESKIDGLSHSKKPRKSYTKSSSRSDESYEIDTRKSKYYKYKKKGGGKPYTTTRHIPSRAPSRKPSIQDTNSSSNSCDVDAVVSTVKEHCHCKKSKCLKLYCQCFASNIVCDGCLCVDCHNIETFSKDRDHAIASLLERNPLAFISKIGKSKSNSLAHGTHRTGCKCKRSACRKRYCECYSAGVACSSNCICIGCENMTDSTMKPKESFYSSNIEPELSPHTSGNKISYKKSYSSIHSTSNPKPRKISKITKNDNTSISAIVDPHTSGLGGNKKENFSTLFSSLEEAKQARLLLEKHLSKVDSSYAQQELETGTE